MLPKVIEKGGRENFNEGRTFQMGFSFLKKTSESEYECVQDLSTCKDYLNDWIYSANTGKAVFAYGLSTNQDVKFLDENKFYLGIKILPKQLSGDDYGVRGAYTDYSVKPPVQMPNDFGPIQADRERLQKNYPNIKVILNYLDDLFGVELKSDIVQSEDPDLFVITADAFWAKYAYRISLYTLFIRMAQFYDGSVSPEEFIKNYNISLDKQLWAESKSYYEDLVKNGMFELDYGKYAAAGFSNSTIHNAGLKNQNREFAKTYSFVDL